MYERYYMTPSVHFKICTRRLGFDSPWVINQATVGVVFKRATDNNPILLLLSSYKICPITKQIVLTDPPLVTSGNPAV